VRVAIARPPKPIRWLGDSLNRLRNFPEDVKDDLGAGLMWAQMGDKHADAKPMRGFGGASVLEIVENHDGDTYRAVYTVRFKERIYVLHCFQKKSKKGSETPKHDIRLIEERLEQARALEERMKS
jgi:phage-related protein